MANVGVFSMVIEILKNPLIIIGYVVLLLVFGLIKLINIKPKPKQFKLPSKKVKITLPKISKQKTKEPPPEAEEEDLV